MILNKIKTLCLETRNLRMDLLNALRFKNEDRINRISYHLANNNAMIADHVMDLLERIEKADPKGVISAAIDANIKVTNDTPINVHSIDRYRGK